MNFSSLPMYDFPHLQKAWDGFYADFVHECSIRDLQAPPSLTRGEGAMKWDGNVFLSMTCGAPFRNELSNHLELLGTADFGEGGYYHSKIIGSPQKHIRLAVNDLGSQSGFHAIYDHIATLGNNVEVIISGSHQKSMEMVSNGQADMAGIDAQSYKYIIEFAPEFANIPIWMETKATPALPFVTSQKTQINTIREALLGVINQSLYTKKLGIHALAQIPRETYLSISNAKLIV